LKWAADNGRVYRWVLLRAVLAMRVSVVAGEEILRSLYVTAPVEVVFDVVPLSVPTKLLAVTVAGDKVKLRPFSVRATDGDGVSTVPATALAGCCVKLTAYAVCTAPTSILLDEQ